MIRRKNDRYICKLSQTLFLSVSTLLDTLVDNVEESTYLLLHAPGTLAQNSLHLHGVFESAKDGKVSIRRDDGKLSTLSLAELIQVIKVGSLSGCRN